MTDAAAHAGHDPDRISFTTALRFVRQTIAHQGAFPPHQQQRDSLLWRTFTARLLSRLNPARRRRSAPRVIKRKYTKWHVKRAAHTVWPQPAAITTVIVQPHQLNGVASSRARLLVRLSRSRVWRGRAHSGGR